jgi:hypothetical protein
MKSRIYHVFRWLYFRHLMPQRIWFFVYDRLHRKVDNKWRGERKNSR